jgi:hypothetical protein
MDPPNFQTKNDLSILRNRFVRNILQCQACLKKSEVLLSHHQPSSIRMTIQTSYNYHTVPALWTSLPAELRIHDSDTGSTSPFALSTPQFLEKFKTCLFHHTSPP